MAPMFTRRNLRIIAPTAIIGIGMAYLYGNKNITKSFSQLFSSFNLNGTSLSTGKVLNKVEPSAFSTNTANGNITRIVSVGDLHGDLPQMQKVFQLMGLTNKQNKWAGGNTHFVQTGDVVDRGDDTIEMYKFMQRLEKEAEAAGGKVYALLGNHEIMNLQNDLRYVTEGDTATYGGAEKRAKEWSKEGSLGKWLREKDTICKVGTTIFVHAGLNSKHFDDLAKINAKVRKAIDTPEKVPRSEQILGASGPVWYRGYALNEGPEVCKDLRKVLKQLGATRMVSGHTPNKEGFLVTCGGSYVDIDIGISPAYYSNLGGLEMLKNEETGEWEAFAVYRGGKKQKLPPVDPNDNGQVTN